MKIQFRNRDGVLLAETSNAMTIRMMDCIKIGDKTYFISAANIERPYDKQTVTVDEFPVATEPVAHLPQIFRTEAPND